MTGNKANAIIGDAGAGWAQVPYLYKLLMENYKRHQQLKELIQSTEDNREYLELVNRGLDNSIGLLESLPIKDENILQDLKSFKDSYKTITDLYGVIPPGSDRKIHKLHDKSVAESIRMVGDVHKYAEKQERNALLLEQQGRMASPKGAARMAVNTNAKILHTLNQLLKVNSQMLKLQGENLAMMNKEKKDDAGHFHKINSDMKKSLKYFSQGLSLPRF